MNKTIYNLKSGYYKVVDNQGVSVTNHFTQCLEKEFADLEVKLIVTEKALELACKKELRESGVYTEDYASEQKLFQLIEDYKHQAKEAKDEQSRQ